MNYPEALEYLAELEIFGSQLGLARVTSLLARLGNPQEKYKTIHVTGTNGKGSVTAILAKILNLSGVKTGMYTSPHLVRYTERIAIDGDEISRTDFAAVLTAVRDAVSQMLASGEESPTQFEVLTAAAFFYFAQKGVDYAVIEVGLGGLLDSTNVIQPCVTVITNVTLEHADKCGGTLKGVALHKAGIIKPGVPVVTAAEIGSLPLEIIEKKAKEQAAKLFVFQRDFFLSSAGAAKAGQNIIYSENGGGKKLEAVLGLIGTYQRQNAAVAIKAARILAQADIHLSDGSIKTALEIAKWPGRFEIFACPENNAAIVIDGAHNPGGMTALKESLYVAYPKEHRIFLLGILEDKDIAQMLKILLRSEDDVIITLPHSSRAASPEKIAEYITGDGFCQIEKDQKKALALALDRLNQEVKKNNGAILCLTGSLYLIGELRQMIVSRYDY